MFCEGVKRIALALPACFQDQDVKTRAYAMLEKSVREKIQMSKERQYFSAQCVEVGLDAVLREVARM